MKTLFIALFFVASLGFYQSANANEKNNLLTISPDKAYEIIKNNKENQKFEILDVRTLQEFNTGHIAKVQQIDYYSPDFKSKINNLDKSKTYLIYCRSGKRSGRTLSLMTTLGFTKVYNMGGGINQWNQMGFPLDR